MSPEPAPPAAPSRSWHALDAAKVLSLLGTDPDAGLAAAEAARRRVLVRTNRVGEHRETPLWRPALAQFRSVVVLLLLAAAAVAWTLRERLEALAILAALLLNGSASAPSGARACRSPGCAPWRSRRRGCAAAAGSWRLPARDLVPGDLVLLEAGSQIPADLRLVRSAALRVTEAALTGESLPVGKDAAARLAPDTPLAERARWPIWARRRWRAAASAWSRRPAWPPSWDASGQLVALEGERATPLERHVEQLGRRLILLALGICGIVAVAGVLHGEPPGLMVETGISLAVAAIPEGLPARPSCRRTPAGRRATCGATRAAE